ncbi:PhoU domain-containing protein [Desulfogranum japonicum]|uniref:PhoU domain-containing protein n=1 Tax=Desulfogranum japonicum TaxID=231447 RepID=UPI0004252639|nr:PhoU domain-containing protein [Desulfogranum japonicum]
MAIESKVSENIHFLLMEVMGQVATTESYLRTFDQTHCLQVLGREGYIENLKVTVENDCFSLILTQPDRGQQEVNWARAVHTISTNLKRIASFSVNIVRQVEYLFNRTLWLTFDAHSMFAIIENCLEQVIPALDDKDIGLALSICHCEYEIDRLYLENFTRIMEELRKGDSIESYVTILFIFRYLERIGDSLLNIGEAILFAILGEKIRIRHFEALQQTLAKSNMDIPLDHLSLRSYWGTRSGCNISRVANEPAGVPAGTVREAIFKAGSLNKIEREKENLTTWQRLVPGLAPKVLTFYQEDENTGALLVEFFPGNNLQEIVLGDNIQMARNALKRLHHLLGSKIWPLTKKVGAMETSYMAQVLARLDSILQVHSYLRRQQTLGDLEVDSTSTLVEKCLRIERLFPAPFSVFIHGDFNANNIIYNEQLDSIHFIDVNRSAPADYVQDVSVYLISNFRLPVFESPIREQINLLIRDFYGFARGFAREQNDVTFDVRLTLALARSFYTSTRFQLNTDFVKEMVLRANFLLEKVITFDEEQQNWQEFSFPEEVLYL